MQHPVQRPGQIDVFGDVVLHEREAGVVLDLGEVRFDDPIAIKATQDMIALLPNMPKEVIESPWGIYDVEAKKVFLAGDAAMMIDYQHLWYQSRDTDLSALGDDPVRVAVIPGKGGGLPATGGQSVGECFAIPRTRSRFSSAMRRA